MRALASWAGRDVLDIGCGTGFHLPRFAETRRVGDRRRAAPRPGRARPAAYPPARRTSPCCQGTAQALPLPDASVDVVHARWAYFFGPGCEPGLAELDRVVRRGGTAFVIDNDPTRSTFGGWFRRGYPKSTPTRSSGSGRPHGWTRDAGRHRAGLRLPRGPRGGRADRVRRADVADAVLAGHEGTEVDYAVNLWWQALLTARRSPTADDERRAGAADAARLHERLVGPSRRGAAHPTSSTATCSSGWRTEVSPGGTTWAARESSKPTTATSLAGSQAAVGAGCAARPSPGCRTRRRTPVGRASSSSSAEASRPDGDGVLDPDGEPGGRQAALVHGARSSRSAGPRRSGSPCASRSRRSAGGPRSSRWSVASSAPAAPSTSTHAWRGLRLVPGPAEGDERRPALLEPGGLRVAGVGVGHHEGVHGGRAQQVVVPGDRVVGVAGEQQHVVAGARRRSRPASARSGPSARWRCPPARARTAARSGARSGCAGCGRPGWASSRARRSPPAPGRGCRRAAGRGC